MIYVNTGDLKLEVSSRKSAKQIYEMYADYRAVNDFVGMDMCRKFLEMGFTRARRYANHKDGNKYDENGNVKPHKPDAMTSEKAQAKYLKFLEIEQKTLNI